MTKPIPSQSRQQPVEHDLPLHTPSLASLLLAASIATIAWLALAAQTDITVHRMLSRGLGVFDGIERLSSYLTNLTIFAVAICFSCVAARAGTPVGRFFRKPPVVTAVVVYIVFVGLAYNLLLRYLWTPSGYRAVLNECLHTVVPVLSAMYWVLFVPRFHLTVHKTLLWLIYPLGYLCVTLWRGSTSDFYPYPFIDVGELGYPHVLLNASLLVVAFLVLMAVFIALNHRRPH
ncbi:FAR-17a/AIG1-like protein [Burkholderia sp. PAMC 28687]|uniref:Pr6Pr family membrane protein n=1 Tax=Burkholderia sp. PAMC 28687 TaxID=1795874 RepID=UPI0007812A17|nr:Pr6Pr family membrane protein [Burkholderia sp. PAMC 28687]AMM17504.1 FAR-17a/AIG1-like protein [Burkholderia sp. PAMC 28687]